MASRPTVPFNVYSRAPIQDLVTGSERGPQLVPLVLVLTDLWQRGVWAVSVFTVGRYNR